MCATIVHSAAAIRRRLECRIKPEFMRPV